MDDTAEDVAPLIVGAKEVLGSSPESYRGLRSRSQVAFHGSYGEMSGAAIAANTKTTRMNAGMYGQRRNPVKVLEMSDG